MVILGLLCLPAWRVGGTDMHKWAMIEVIPLSSLFEILCDKVLLHRWQAKVSFMEFCQTPLRNLLILTFCDQIWWSNSFTCTLCVFINNILRYFWDISRHLSCYHVLLSLLSLHSPPVLPAPPRASSPPADSSHVAGRTPTVCEALWDVGGLCFPGNRGRPRAADGQAEESAAAGAQSQGDWRWLMTPTMM